MNLKLRQLRESMGFTQKELATAIGSTLRKISSWENMEVRIPLSDAAKIADVFDCSLDELAGRDFHQSQDSLTTDERRIVNAYRSTDERGRDAITETAEREVRAFERGGTPEAQVVPPRELRAG